MPYERVPRSDAGPWTTVLGLCLALVAAGSFIAFSLVARDATSAGLDVPVTAIAPVASAPALTFAQPGDDEVDGRDGVRRSTNGRDLVLGTRFANGPVTKAPGRATSGGGDCTSRCGRDKGNPDMDTTPGPVVTRGPDRGSGEGKGKGKGKPPWAGGNGIGGGNPAGAGPSPNGKAKGHIKAKGKGHDKHPGDH